MCVTPAEMGCVSGHVEDALHDFIYPITPVFMARPEFSWRVLRGAGERDHAAAGTAGGLGGEFGVPVRPTPVPRWNSARRELSFLF